MILSAQTTANVVNTNIVKLQEEAMRRFFGWEVGILLATAIAEAATVSLVILWGKNYGIEKPENVAVAVIIFFTIAAVVEAAVMVYLWVSEENTGIKKRRHKIGDEEEKEVASTGWNNFVAGLRKTKRRHTPTPVSVAPVTPSAPHKKNQNTRAAETTELEFNLPPD